MTHHPHYHHCQVRHQFLALVGLLTSLISLSMTSKCIGAYLCKHYAGQVSTLGPFPVQLETSSPAPLQRPQWTLSP